MDISTISKNATRFVTVLAVSALALPALAQLDDSYEESEVQSVGEEREEAPRESIRDQIQGAARADARWFEENIDLAQVERMDTAMNRLRDLVQSAAHGSEQRANYMFRLAELYYTKARFFEQRAYDRRDRAFLARNENPAQSRQYELAADDDLEQSDRYATQAVEVYVELYADYHDTYPDMDAVLYYLGSTLSQLGRTEDALDFFQELANDYPSSLYMSRALLAFGEYYFQQGEMQEAQLFYQAVSEFPESSIYPYALYQEAWCFFNTEDYPQALQRLIDAVNASTGESSGRIRMRQRALHDTALFYVEVGNAAEAFGFFEAVAPDEVEEMVTLVANIFSEDGHYAEANSLFQELMARNPDTFELVKWQEEIVRNTLPSEEQTEIVREVRRLVELYNTAKDFEDAEPAEVTEAGERIEYQVRRLATTYHREAQVLNNESVYALSYNLYEDYVTHFSDIAETATAYTMSFYYAELLYRNERYEDAARMWERCLEVNPTGEYTEQATYKAVLAYTRLVDLETIPDIDIQAEDDGSVPIPEPVPLPVVMENLLAAADRYLAINPPDEYAVEVEYVAARVLYDYAHLDEVVPRFGNIAMNYANVDGQRARVSAELLLDSLGALHRYAQMEEWVDRLRDSPLATGEFSETLEGLGQQITFSRCRDIQAAEDHEEAGLCFFEFFSEYRDSELADSALYNAGFSFDEVKMFARAIRVRELLLQFRPDSELAEETRFTLAEDFHKLALYRDAAQHYEDFATDYPGSEHAMSALANAALFRSGLGEYEQAIADYETFIDIFDDHDEEVAEAVFQIGRIYHEQGQTREAGRQFQRYLDRYADRGQPGRAIEATSRLGQLEWNDDPEEAEAYFIQVLDLFNNLGEEHRNSLQGDALDAAAEARFKLGEFIFQRFQDFALTGDETQVQEQLRELLAIGAEAVSVYEQVRAFRRPGWSIAAFTRSGQLWGKFYEAVVNAPIPDGMVFEVEEQYLSALEEFGSQYREGAILSYQTALEIARTSGWFNEYTELAEENLSALDPSFRRGSEIRSRPGYEPSGFFSAEFIRLGEEEAEEIEEQSEPEPTQDTEQPLSERVQ